MEEQLTGDSISLGERRGRRGRRRRARAHELPHGARARFASAAVMTTTTQLYDTQFPANLINGIKKSIENLVLREVPKANQQSLISDQSFEF